MAVMTLCLGLSTAAMAQTRQVRGKVIDARTDEALTGATIISTKTNAGAVALSDGTFSIPLPSSAQEVRVSFLGYHEQTIAIAAGGDLNLGTIAMEPDAYAMDAVVISAGIVIKDRETPVAISNVPLEIIEMKLSNQEFPEILKSTPSVYATKDGGGYGDSRISMRGFNSENIGVLINGVPVNDMENGRVYWSNWAGLSDVTSLIQVQRGLGASKLGLSSVGGTINIVTKSTDAVQGGSIYYGVGNDGLQKQQFTVSTGLMDNGWAMTFSGGHTAGDGYVLGTDFEGWNYFANISKQLGGGHRLSLTAFGAPQWHNQRSYRQSIEYVKENGIKANPLYGYRNGELMAVGRNEYHKPQISLVHYWTINENSQWSTSVYASMSSGNGRTTHGKDRNWLRTNTDGTDIKDATRRNHSGLIDWDGIFEDNKNNINGSSAILARSLNSHDWYGILSTYNNKITDNITITAGVDGRYYRGYHKELVDDLLGGLFYEASGAPTKDNPDGNGEAILDGLGRDGTEKLGVGDVLGYDEIGEVLWAGVFAQGEYVKDNFSAFLSGTITSHSYRWSNYGTIADQYQGKATSDWVGFLPISVKGGANYKFAEYHNIFLNGGYFTRAPFKNNAFEGYSTRPNPEAKMEQVITGELGYGFANNYLNISLNGYYTLWLDKSQRPLALEVLNEETGEIEERLYNFSGVNAQHMGIELEATYRPTTNFNLKGMFSFGDWIWRDDARVIMYDDNRVELGRFEAYIAGIHVGNSAQMTASLAANWQPFKGFNVGLDFNYFGKNFANFTPENRSKPTDRTESWQMPDYYTFDLSARYKFNIGKQWITVYGNINNLFGAEYISDATDGAINGGGHEAVNATVYYGFGRTWTFGLKFNF